MKIFKDFRFISAAVVLFVIAIVLLVINYTPKPTPAPLLNQDTGPIPTEFPQNEVTITKNGFEPAEVKIKPNTVVVWLNKSGGVVSINSDPYPKNNLYPELNLGNVDVGGSTQSYFQNTGTYTYHNNLNPDHYGKIVVE